MTAAGRRRGRGVRPFLILLGALICFGIGVGLGEALHDNPKPGGTQTIVRTLAPLPLAPAAATTVSVTTGKR